MKFDITKLDYLAAYKLAMSSVTPRPIAWVSTVSAAGVNNLAPFSGFGTMGTFPFMVHINCGTNRDGKQKDTLVNIQHTGDFVVNLVTEPLARAMNQSSYEYPPDVSEFKEVGMTPLPGEKVKSPRVAESPVNMECRLVQIIEFGHLPRMTSIVLGEVIFLHIKDDLVVNGEIDSARLNVIARLGGGIYCRTNDIFKLDPVWRPSEPRSSP